MIRADQRLQSICVAYAISVAAMLLVIPSESAGFGLLSVPLLLLTPGYALLSAWARPRSETPGESLFLSVLLSFAVLVLGGLLLNLLPSGLTEHSWIVYLASVTVGGSLISLLRGPHPDTHLASPASTYFSLRGVTTAIIIVALVAAAAVLARHSATSAQRARTTQLSIIRDDGHRRARLWNLEGSPAKYRVVVHNAAQAVDVRHILLRNGEAEAINLPGSGATEVEVYRGASRRLLRMVSLTG